VRGRSHSWEAFDRAPYAWRSAAAAAPLRGGRARRRHGLWLCVRPPPRRRAARSRHLGQCPRTFLGSHHADRFWSNAGLTGALYACIVLDCCIVQRLRKLMRIFAPSKALQCVSILNGWTWRRHAVRRCTAHAAQGCMQASTVTVEQPPVCGCGHGCAYTCLGGWCDVHNMAVRAAACERLRSGGVCMGCGAIQPGQRQSMKGHAPSPLQHAAPYIATNRLAGVDTM
jgi:hypothetical protein